MASDKYLQIRIEKEEKDKILKAAKQEDFNHVSTFLLWMIRKGVKKITTVFFA